MRISDWSSDVCSSDLAPALRHVATSTLRSAYRRGLVLHLTNPKAILFFGSLYAVGVPAGASVETLALVIAAVGLQSLLLFHGYADRKSVVEGKSVSVRVDLGGRRCLKKKK